ncbi:MAG: DUF2867 domain-containing protein [Bacteroides sp.]|uniref:DUF2867 domain-containing protein n=1 Tax=Bacteroides sp. TaxID=29523 RepID=UPI002FCB5E79
MKIPNSTLLSQYLPVDYIDTYQREIKGKKEFQPEELLKGMFTHLPWWIDGLMKWRNILVKPLGLRGGKFEQHLSEMILNQNENEIVWGMNDKHLCFYVSIWCSQRVDTKQTIGITTVVKYNNLLGKIYFFTIKPFHKIIIKSLLKKI